MSRAQRQGFGAVVRHVDHHAQHFEGRLQQELHRRLVVGNHYYWKGMGQFSTLARNCPLV